MTHPEARSPQDESTTERIPRDAWDQFLQQFTEFNAEMPVRIELVGSAETGTGILADNQPLLDVTLDDATGVPLILIECGDPAALAAPDRAAESFRHVVRQPTALWARKTGGPPGAAGWDAIEIEGGDGSVNVSLGRHPAGVAPQEDAGKELLQAGWRSAP